MPPDHPGDLRPLLLLLLLSCLLLLLLLLLRQVLDVYLAASVVQEGALQQLLETAQSHYAILVQEERSTEAQQHLAKVTGVLLLLHLPFQLLLALALQCCCRGLLTQLLPLLLPLLLQVPCDVKQQPPPPPPSLQL